MLHDTWRSEVICGEPELFHLFLSFSKMKGSDNQEKLVYQIIEDAGNKGNELQTLLVDTHGH